MARGNGDGTVSGRFLAEPGNPLRDGGRLVTRIDYDDARTTTTRLDPGILAEPAFRFLLQLAAPNVGQIWTATRDGTTLVRVSGDSGAWAELDPATGVLTQGGPVDLFEYIGYAADQWGRLGYPETGRFGITAGPAGHTSWLDSPQHPVPTMTP